MTHRAAWFDTSLACFVSEPFGDVTNRMEQPMKSYLVATSAFTVFLCTGVLAEEKRAADAHQHGHGVLNVALEGETLGIELSLIHI